mmetsp:Transcript_393/g.1436  ORF Transcript_393/g.1436 Transcript_393/m.1436 type:complete len:249 (+) Transcript_393:792-1538(+)
MTPRMPPRRKRTLVSLAWPKSLTRSLSSAKETPSGRSDTKAATWERRSATKASSGGGGSQRTTATWSLPSPQRSRGAPWTSSRSDRKPKDSGRSTSQPCIARKARGRASKVRGVPAFTTSKSWTTTKIRFSAFWSRRAKATRLFDDDDAISPEDDVDESTGPGGGKGPGGKGGAKAGFGGQGACCCCWWSPKKGCGRGGSKMEERKAGRSRRTMRASPPERRSNQRRRFPPKRRMACLMPEPWPPPLR